MADSLAKTTQGTVVKWDSKLVSEVKTVGDIGNDSRGEIDVTHLGSTARETIAGLMDYGEIPISGNYIKADVGQAALLASQVSGAVATLEVDFTTEAEKATCSAWVKSFKVGNIQPDGAYQFTAVLKVTGAIAFDPIVV
jgi:hypothetical protein